AARLSTTHSLIRWEALEDDGRAAQIESLSAHLLRARTAYEDLDGELALDAADIGINAGLALSTDPEALAVLAQLWRLRGRVSLFMERAEQAARSFALASELDPEFSPTQQEWPPESRLAYSDARASRRRGVPGALSVRVEPACAAVSIDGRRKAIGSTTVNGLAPGAHMLEVRCPGFVPFGAIFEVDGEGTLDERSVFLPPLKNPNGDRARAMLDGRGEFSQMVSPGRHRLVVLARRDGSVELRSGAGLGERELLDLDDPSLVTQIEERLLEPAPAEDRAWYERPWVWVVAGVVVAGAATTAIVATQSEDTERLRLVIGR
ncbi:MAG: hypothetical protein AAFQ82_06605, partial [Myxococcota bacterium]